MGVKVKIGLTGSAGCNTGTCRCPIFRPAVPSMNERIGILRAKQGMSGEEFAAALGFEGKNRRSTINNWESGANNVKADDIENICRVFGVSADWLLGLSEENNYSADSAVKLVSDFTGLSTVAVERIHNLDKEKRAVLSEIIEHDISGLLDALDSALMSCDSLDKVAAEVSDDLCFDDKNRPYLKLSPENTVSYFVNKTSEFMSNMAKILVNEHKIKAVEERISNTNRSNRRRQKRENS